MTINARCTDRDNCGRRKTLPKDPETGYIRIPKCPGCGRKTLRADPSVRRQTLKRTCRCGGVHFPHRAGTVLSHNEFCHQLTLDQVRDYLVEHEIMTFEEINQL